MTYSDPIGSPGPQFPEGFIFGGSTAAYQVEGETRTHGKGKVAWDDYLADQGRFSPDPASDFYNRYEQDLELCERFGINGIRVSIAWTRIFPEGTGQVNPEGVQFYHDLFSACHAHGVEPFVTLHHFDTPLPLFEAGEFLNRDTIDAFVEYARFCFEEYAGEVTYWATFNEIWADATNHYIEGTFPGGEKAQLHKCFQCEHNMMLAHARAVLAFKEGGYPGKIGVIQSLEYKYPLDENDPADIAAAKNEDVLQNQFLLDATFRGDYAPDTLEIAQRLTAVSGGELDIREEDLDIMRAAAKVNDYLGVNNYQCRFLKAYDGENDLHHNGTGEKGTDRFRLAGVGERVNKPGIPTTGWDWIIYPKGLFDLLVRIKLQYPNYKQIFITENGMGYKDALVDGFVDDAPRIDYVRQHLRWLLKAMELGVNVGGYFMWSLQDQFSWTNGYNKRYGFFYVDYETQRRIPKASAYWFKTVAETRRID